MSKDFKAIISPESTRYQEWVSVFGANEILIQSPIVGAIYSVRQ